MATKPDKVPRWADVSGDITEPEESEKDVGWVVDTRPPAQYMNWLQNLAFEWFEYLRDGVIVGEAGQPGLDVTGGTGTDETVPGGKFLGGGFSPGIRSVGGTLDGVGGEGGIFLGGAGDGAGNDGGFGVHATAVDGGTGVRGFGSDAGWGGLFTGGNSDGAIGVQGDTGAVDGIGVYGLANNAGYGVVAQGDTTSPVRSAFRIVPQDSNPATGALGDIYVHTDGTLRIYNGSAWVKVGTQS